MIASSTAPPILAPAYHQVRDSPDKRLLHESDGWVRLGLSCAKLIIDHSAAGADEGQPSKGYLSACLFRLNC